MRAHKPIEPEADPSPTLFIRIPTSPRVDRPRPAPGVVVQLPAPSVAPVVVATPFAVTRSTPTPRPATNELRVLVLVLGVSFLALLAIVAAVVIALVVPTGASQIPDEDAPVARPEWADTGGFVAEDEEEEPEPRVVSPPRPPREPKPPLPSTLAVRFSGATLPTYLVLECPGSTLRADLSGGTASFSGVPTGATCRLHPKGVVSTAAPVQAGGTYACTITGTTTACG